MTTQIPPGLAAEIEALRPGIEAYPETYVLFPEQLDEHPELWPLFLHLGRDTRCPDCEGASRRCGRFCKLCAGQGEIQQRGRRP